MKVFLLCLDRDRLLFYSERDGKGEPAPSDRPGLIGRLERAAHRVKESFRHPKSRLARGTRKAWDGLQRRMYPDEPLLAALRSASTIEVLHPGEMTTAEARQAWTTYLKRRAVRHGLWLLFNLLLSPLSLLLTPLPGPNVIGYWFAYRAVHHLLILKGIRHAMRGRIETIYQPVDGLDAPVCGADREWVVRTSARFRLKGLDDFVARHSPGPGARRPRRERRDAATMRLLSYNIHKGIGGRDRLYRIDRIVRVVQEEDPDLICLQEVDYNVRRTRHDDQPSRFAEAFQAAGSNYQLNVHLGHGGYGNQLLSRWPWRSISQVSLRQRRRKPRGAQLVVVETPEGPLHLVHWHLGLAERERHWQARHLLEHPSYKEWEHLPTLVVGDFNDWRNTLAGGPFARHALSQVTHPMNRFRSFPAYYPVISLDKAFASGTVDVRHARIVHSALARRASDHLPLVIDFHLKAGPA